MLRVQTGFGIAAGHPGRTPDARRTSAPRFSCVSHARDVQAPRASERGRGSMVCVESCSDGPRAICRILQVPPLTPVPLPTLPTPGAIFRILPVPIVTWQQMPIKRIGPAKMACAQRQTRARVRNSALGFSVERLGICPAKLACAHTATDGPHPGPSPKP
jgi:hypothetical protein